MAELSHPCCTAPKEGKPHLRGSLWSRASAFVRSPAAMNSYTSMNCVAQRQSGPSECPIKGTGRQHADTALSITLNGTHSIVLGKGMNPHRALQRHSKAKSHCLQADKFKSAHPVRLHAGGVEGDNVLVEALRHDLCASSSMLVHGGERAGARYKHTQLTPSLLLLLHTGRQSEPE